MLLPFNRIMNFSFPKYSLHKPSPHTLSVDSQEAAITQLPLTACISELQFPLLPFLLVS